MSEDGSVMVLDACRLTVQPEEPCGYPGKLLSSCSASQLCMGICFIRGLLLGIFFLLVLLAGPKPKPWIKEGECESDPRTGSSGHL